MTEPYIGEIRAVAFGFAPCPDWMLCNGALLSIKENTALFSLIGTLYGGDGVNTFGIPDLRGRSLVGVGSGPGLAPMALGATGGSEAVTISAQQLPAHAHSARAMTPVSTGNATVSNPDGAILAAPTLVDGRTKVNAYAPAAAANAQMAAHPVAVDPAGDSQPLPVRNPYAALNYVIAVSGIYPSRQ